MSMNFLNRMPALLRRLVPCLALWAIVSCGGGGDTGNPGPAAGTSPAISTQPQNTTANEGSSATFSVVASGTAPLTYQWRRDGVAVAGGTAAGFTLVSAASDDATVFDVVVGNSAGSVTSVGARLTVIVAPVIVTAPAPVSAVPGETVTFSVGATGRTLSYQWRRNGMAIVGATAGAYSFVAAAADDGASFSVVVSNAAGAATSTAALLTVQPPATAGAMVAAGGSHSLALKVDGTVWAWGKNDHGQLGVGNDRISASASPLQVSGLTGVTQIAAGDLHSLALKSDGSVWAWGANGAGQLGDGSTTDRFAPVQVRGVSHVVLIATGSSASFSVAATSDGRIWAWGANGEGQLGDGSVSNSSVPVLATRVSGACPAPAVCTPPLVRFLAAGTRHVMAEDQGGGAIVWAWGSNTSGAFGDGGSTSSRVPVQVGPLTQASNSFAQLAAGNQYGMALNLDGSVLTWGTTFSGVLGRGPVPVAPETPSAIASFTGVTAVAAGYGHALALLNDGTVWAWGHGDQGQTGSAFTVTSSPAQVAMLSGIVKISAGGAHSLVVRTDGTVWAFGDDLDGQLGRGFTTSTYSRTPVQVTGLQLF